MAGAAAREGRRARTCCSSCSTTPASASSAATAARSTRRTSTRWPQNGLRYNNMHTTALCSPTRSCILTGRNHHSNAMACITEGSTGYPGRQRHHPVRERLPLRDAAAARLQHLCARQVAPDAGRADLSAAGPYDRWPLGRGFERYYGFLGGDTHQYYPGARLRQPPGRAAEDAGGGLSPHRGSGRQGDRVHRRRQAGRARQAVLPVLLHRARMHAPHHVPKEWADKYKGKFDDGWDAYREKVFARQKELGIIPKDAELSRHDPDVQDWDKLLGRRAEALRPHDGGVRRLPRAHRPPHRPAARLPRRTSASSTTR